VRSVKQYRSHSVFCENGTNSTEDRMFIVRTVQAVKIRVFIVRPISVVQNVG
jgi:hypothetical protein